jgi:hypothetical protein
MKQLISPVVLTAAAGYLVLNYAWLWVANSASVDEPTRSILKTVCLVGAGAIYIAMAGFIAATAETQWMRKTAVNSGTAVALGLALIILSSLVWHRGQFLHDGTAMERLPMLLLLIVGAGVLGAAVAPLVAMLVRLVWRPMTT